MVEKKDVLILNEKRVYCFYFHKRGYCQQTEINWDFMYPIQLVKVQNLSFDMRDFQSASLKFPEFCDLIQKVELNSGLCLQA